LSAEILERLRGKFLVFDGVDGAGKGAQRKLLCDALKRAGVPFVSAFDPGGTAIGDRIRHVLLDYDLSTMDKNCETLLFMASRAQLVAEVLRPALEKGDRCVVCDRYVSATCAYQGAAGFDPQRTIELARYATDDLWPDLTIVIDVAPEVGFQRTNRKTQSRRKRAETAAGTHGQPALFQDVHSDAMEARPISFHQKVRALFMQLPEIYPAPVRIINGEGGVDDVHGRVMEAIGDVIR